MGIRNTLKILSSNFSLTWKSGLYKLICIALVLFLGYLLIKPIFSTLQGQDLIGEAMALFEGVVSFRGGQVATAAQHLTDIVNSLVLDSYIFSIITLFILVFALLPFLFGLSDMAECDVIYSAMSCNTKVKYLASFTSGLKSAIKISAFKLIFTVPYSLIVFAICYGISNLITVGGFITYLGVFLIALIGLVSFTFERAFLGYLHQASVVHNPKLKCVWTRGFVNLLRQFGKNFSMNLVFVIFTFFINAFVGYFTFGVGLIITIPASFVLLTILNMLIYCNAYGLNYYVTPYEVIVSKKLDEQIDLKDMKYLL